MDGKIEKYNSNKQEVTFNEIVIKIKQWGRYFISKKYILLGVFIVGGVLGFLYSWTQKPTFIAESTFVLEDEGSVGIGQYSGLASIVGIDLGSSGTGIFQGDNIIQLYRSNSIIRKSLLSYGDFRGKKKLLLERYIEINELEKKFKLDNIKFSNTRFSVTQDSILLLVIKEIKENVLNVIKPDKKLAIISVQVKAKDELFCKKFNETIVEVVNDFYTKTRVKKSLNNFSILQKQADSLRRVLNISIGSAAAAIDNNPNANVALQILKVPSQRKQVDVQANSAIYVEVVKNLEIARISLRREMPLIQIIDSPILPLEKKGTGRLFCTVLGALLALMLGVISLVIKEIIEPYL